MSQSTLTVAQRLFAAGIANGKSKAGAYRDAYPHQHMKPAVLRQSAIKAAKRPNVQAEIQRLMSDPILFMACPQASDPAIVRQHAVAIMTQISRCSDMVMAAHAADWLARYADQLEAQQAAAKARPHEEKQRLLADLRGLYQKALAAPRTPSAPLVETVLEAEPVAGETAASEPASATPMGTPQDRS